MEVEELFQKALKFDSPDQRAEFLSIACDGDESLLQEVEGLLKAHDEVGTFLEQPFLDKPLQEGKTPKESAPNASDPLSHDDSTVLRTGDSGDSIAHSTSNSDKTPATSTRSEVLPSHVPGYEIGKELGRGGMGVVYLARQVHANRLVALKVVLGEHSANTEDRLRFNTEVEAIARLQHPGIVQIFEVGEHQGYPFFSLEYCSGGSLDHYLGKNPVPARDAAKLMIDLCSGMSAAHDAKIIHRDLKPANVLLAPRAESASVPTTLAEEGSSRPPLTAFTLKVTDFGLAKKLDATTRTGTGMILGTPSYVAPEQAEGKRNIGIPADIYGLGAILYELLTGRPPFVGINNIDTVLRVMYNEPASPRQLQPGVPRDLETICLKCLAKEPGKRYASAEELAEELQRYLQGVPIHARPLGIWGRGIRWVRRFPVVSALLLTLLISILTGVGVSAWYAIEADRNAQQSDKNAEQAETNATIAEANAREARKEAERARTEEQLAKKQRNLAESIAYSRSLFSSRQAWMMGNRSEAWHLLDQSQKDLRGWEFYYLRTQLLKEPMFSGHSQKVEHLAFSPDDRLLASASTSDVRLWDLASQKLKAQIRVRGELFDLAFSSDGSRLALLDSNELAFYKTATGEKERTIEDNWVRPARQQVVAWSLNGKLIAAAAEQQLRIWDTESGEPVNRFPVPAFCRYLIFSHDARQILVVAIDGAMSLWDLEINMQKTLPTFRDALDAPPVFQNGNVYFWVPIPNESRGYELVEIHDRENRLAKTSADLEHWDHVAYSPERNRLAVADREIEIWDLHREQPIVPRRKPTSMGRGKPDRVMSGRWGNVTALAMSHDGRWIASAGSDKQVCVWNSENRMGHHLQVRSIPLSDFQNRPRQGHLAHPTLPIMLSPANPQGDILVWDVATGESMGDLFGHSQIITHMVFHPDAKRLFTGSMDQTIRIWDARSFEAIATLEGHESPIYQIVPIGDSSYLASVDDQKHLIIWDVKAKSVSKAFDSFNRVSIAGDPVGCRIAFLRPGPPAGKPHELIVYDCQSETETLLGWVSDVPRLQFRPQGDLIVALENGVVQTYSRTGDKRTYTLSTRMNPKTMVISANGTYFAAAIGEEWNEVGLLNLDNGNIRTEFETSRNPIERLAFTPDNQRLVSEEFDRGVDDGLLKIWQLNSTQPAMVLQNPLGTLFNNSELRGSVFGPLVQLAFCSSGKYLVCTSPHGVLIRDANKSVAYRFNVQAGKCVSRLRPDAKQFAVNNALLAQFWDVKSSSPQWNCNCNGTFNSIDFSPDNQLVAVCNEMAVEIRDATSGKMVRRVGNSNDLSSAVRFGPLGTILATGDQAGRIVVWELGEEDNGFELREGIGKGAVIKIVLSGNQERLAASYSDKWRAGDFYPTDYVLVWDLRTKDLIAQLEAKDSPFGDFDMTSTGQTLAVAKGERGVLWDVADQRVMRSFSTSPKQILSLDIGPDDQKVLTSGADGCVRLWTMKDPNRELFLFDGHVGNVKAEFDGSGAWILSRGSDGTCCLFQPSGRKEVYPLIRPINWLLAP